MIEVVLSHHGNPVSRVFDIEDPETAVFAARTLWDDANDAHPLQGYHRGLSFAFLVDGQVVRTVEGKRP